MENDGKPGLPQMGELEPGIFSPMSDVEGLRLYATTELPVERRWQLGRVRAQQNTEVVVWRRGRIISGRVHTAIRQQESDDCRSQSLGLAERSAERRNAI